jgi:DNA-binding response OmpR family regulator
MLSSHGYVLVLDPELQGQHEPHPLAAQLPYPVFVANSAEQAVSCALRTPPGLVILMGDTDQHGLAALVSQFRQNAHAGYLTIVALSNAASPQWNYVEETPGLDGFLVKPLSADILRSLMESAFARINPS